MIRRIIEIDSEKCNGCGLCAKTCHEGAIGMTDGKAVLLRDDYCDVLGDCLPACPTGAISFIEREALPYNESAVQAKHNAAEFQSRTTAPSIQIPHRGCPGTHAQLLSPIATTAAAESEEHPSALAQWPVQLRLVPQTAPWFDDADLLIAADCTAYAYAGMHEKWMRGRITLIGCPKLDFSDTSGYTEKLTAILQNHHICSLTVVRMEVPCCGGLENACKNAIRNSGKDICLSVVTISVNGKILP